jgi:hypothetical protein
MTPVQLNSIPTSGYIIEKERCVICAGESSLLLDWSQNTLGAAYLNVFELSALGKESGNFVFCDLWT